MLSPHQRWRHAFDAFRRSIKSALRAAWTVVREYLHDHGPLMASAISFHAILSLFPLLLLGVSALGYVYDSETAMDEVLSVLGQYAPGQVVNTVQTALITIVETRAQVLAIGILTLLWTSSTVFAIMEAALCMAWNVSGRPFWKARLLSFAMLLVVGCVLAASVGFATLTLRVEGLRWYLFGHSLDEIPRMWNVLGTLLPLGLASLAFTVFYLVLPNTRVHLRAAALGGAFSGVLWQAALYVFRLFLTHYARYDVVYGSLGGAVVLVLWVYYTMNVLLLGAEVAWQMDQRLRRREGRPANTPEEKLSAPTPLPEN